MMRKNFEEMKEENKGREEENKGSSGRYAEPKEGRKER